MQLLIEQINSIPLEVKKVIDSRLNEFSSFATKSEEEWFSELCFCLLTANSKASTAISLQNDLGFKGFAGLSEPELVEQIKSHKHRFHNTKASRIVLARKYLDIKKTIQNIVKSNGQSEAREWLVKNVHGLGYKESSHFLRNTGHENLAILDRHILNLMHEHKLISEIKPLNAKTYLATESHFNSLASQLKMSPSRLDLCMWYIRTGKVLK